VVRNLSAHGALLRVAASTDVPEEFDLQISKSGAFHHCVRVWQEPGEMGVKFRANGAGRRCLHIVS
jgi:hypothetical protein